MPSIRHTIVSASLAAGLVLAAGSAMLSSTAPATAPAFAPVESKIATVDTLLLLQALWERPEMDVARKALETEITNAFNSKQAEVSASEAQLQQTLQSLQARFNSLPEGDPERDNIVASYQSMQTVHQSLTAQLDELRNDIEMRLDTQRANQIRECYVTLQAAIATVAQREGYTHVLSHATTQEQFEAFGFEGVLQGIRDRPVVFAPEGTDLTETMFAELGVTRPTFELTPPGGPTDPAGPVPPAGLDPTPVTPPETDPAAPPATPPATPPGR